MGNNLQYSASFVSGLTPAQASTFTYDTKLVGIIFNFQYGYNSFKDISFFNNYAVALDIKSVLLFFKCRQTNSVVYCDEVGHLSLDNTHTLQKRSNQLFNYCFAWTTTSTGLTWAFTFDGQMTVSKFLVPGAPYDLVTTELYNTAYLLASYPANQQIQHWSFDQTAPGAWVQLPANHHRNVQL
jgi:hypothetical protein